MARCAVAGRMRRAKLFDIIEARIATRKPASYLTNSAYIRGRRFYVDERVIVPRSYIGELLDRGLEGVIDDPGRVTRVLDLCTGGGSLAILAAHNAPHIAQTSAFCDAVLQVLGGAVLWRGSQNVRCIGGQSRTGCYRVFECQTDAALLADFAKGWFKRWREILGWPV